MSRSSRKEKDPAFVASAVLPDGSIVEMVFRSSSSETVFLICRGDEVSEHKDVEIPGIGKAVPYSPDNNLLAHKVIHLPTDVGSYETTTALFVEVKEFIHRYADLSSDFEDVAAHYVLLSWIYDAYNELPYLRLKGDYGSGKSRCLSTIGSICYKPMFVSGASTVSPVFRIIDSFRGTLILDESDFRASDERAEIVKILNNGNAEGFPVLRSEATPTNEYNPRAFAVFGPKIIATRKDFEDQALESRCITETMSGSNPRSDIPLTLPKVFPGEATSLRNKLLAFRFKNLQHPPLVDLTRHGQVEARVSQIFAPLIAVAGLAGAKSLFERLAVSKSSLLLSYRGSSVEAQLLEAIRDSRKPGQAAAIKEVTGLFAERFGSEYRQTISPRWIGSQIRRRLSLWTVKSHGNFVIPISEEAKLRHLFERYDVEPEVDMGMMGTDSTQGSENLS